MKLQFAAALAACVLAAPLSAHEYTLGDLVIDHPVALETPKTAKSGAGYLSVTNTGEAPDRLLEVRADFPMVMLHTTEESDGVARMVHLEGIDIPAGETVTLAPSGMHVMFMGLDNPFEVGEQVPATLVFEEAGEVDVVFEVEARDGADGGMGDHSGHD
ncbi:copper chaperone PCu(A)C [Roseovarius spongiae]|uniref:Copper chaperone PCu(A)C n=1 Tax=Roseovarius spongiae TaxID=2320272 RepID=A0A3A8B3C1_9RHOB|nr:copper chaperone PCu(A)C [Roseovarius spongiae]RKF15032.1 copper chaperone PCu(A)C [Roseovarius spongiae]